MAAINVLLLVPLLLAASAALEGGTRGEKGSPASQQSCPAHSWLEEELAHFLHSTKTATDGAVSAAGKATAPQHTPEDAAAFAAAARGNGAYTEMTEAAVEAALQNQPVALVLRNDGRCTDSAPQAIIFAGVAAAFARMSLLEPKVLFAKVIPEEGASARKPGMRQGDGSTGCGLQLHYKQEDPTPTETEAEEEEGQAADPVNMKLAVQESSAVDELKLQIIKLAFPPTLLVRDQKLLDQILFEFPRALLRFFPGPADVTPVAPAVLVAAGRLPLIDIDEPSLAAKFEVNAPSQLLVGSQGFRKSFSMNEDDQEEQLRLIRAMEEPATVRSLTSGTAPSIFTELRPVVFFFAGAEPAIAEDFAFTEAATAWGSSYAFCSSVRPSALQSRAIDYLGLRGKPLPQVVVVTDIGDPRLTTKFICQNVSTKEAIFECLTEFKEGKLGPYYKAAPPPKLQKGPIYELVGSRFKTVVIDSAQEVLLLVYSPSCPHSAIFMPMFEELAVRMANEESLLVARLDGTANEVPGINVPLRSTRKSDATTGVREVQPDIVSVHGYPVVVFFARKDPQQNLKIPIVYTGPRTVEALKDFVFSQTALQAQDDL